MSEIESGRNAGEHGSDGNSMATSGPGAASRWDALGSRSGDGVRLASGMITRGAPLAVFIASLALYVRTLAPDVVYADGGELQFGAWNFSFVHPTGYPLYLILGGVFQHLVPIGNPAYRLNLFTAITAALAVAGVYAVVYELVRRPLPAIVAAFSIAVTRMFWIDAGGAEVYALHAAFVASLVWLALRFKAAPSMRRLVVFCAVLGLALTHHRSIILWMPGLAAFLLMCGWKAWSGGWRPDRVASRAAVLACAVLAPLLLYLYVPLRAPSAPYTTMALTPTRVISLYDNTPAGFVNYVLGRVFQGELKWDATSAARLEAVPQLLLDEFGVIGIAFALIGSAVLVRRREWPLLALVATSFSMVVAFASLYHIGDISHYYTPALLVVTVLAGVGIGAVLEVAQRSRPIFAVVLALAVWLPLSQLAANGTAADRSGETQARAAWTRILSASVPQNAVLISNDRDDMMPFWYMQYVEHVRTDLIGLFPLVTPALEFRNVARLTDTVLDSGRPVLFIKPMPGIEVKYRVTAGNPPLQRVLGRTADTGPQIPCDAVLGGKLRIAGYDVVQEQERTRVVVYYRPQATLDRNLTAFVQLVDSKGAKVAQGNDHQVGGDYYPTSLWQTGETLTDVQSISLPPNLEPATYRLITGMYSQPDQEPLGEPVELGTVTIK